MNCAYAARQSDLCCACLLQVANMHGDEPGGRVLLPLLAEWLCSKQTSDPRAARIIDGMHLVSNMGSLFWHLRASLAGCKLEHKQCAPSLTACIW